MLLQVTIEKITVPGKAADVCLLPGGMFGNLIPEFSNRDPYWGAQTPVPSFYAPQAFLNHGWYCPPGRELKLLGCMPCSVGQYAANPPEGWAKGGALEPSETTSLDEVCIDASPGYFVNGTGSATQSLCPIGTFSDQPGQPSCTDCVPGTLKC